MSVPRIFIEVVQDIPGVGMVYCRKEVSLNMWRSARSAPSIVARVVDDALAEVADQCFGPGWERGSADAR